MKDSVEKLEAIQSKYICLQMSFELETIAFLSGPLKVNKSHSVMPIFTTRYVVFLYFFL